MSIFSASSPYNKLFHSLEIDEATGALIFPEDSSATCIVDGGNPRCRLDPPVERPTSEAYGKWPPAFLTDYQPPADKAGEFSHCRTLWEIVEFSCRIFPNNRCLGTRTFLSETDASSRGNFLWFSYREVYEKISLLKSALKKKFPLKAKSCIAILSGNRLEWILAHLTNYSVNCITVPLSPTASPAAQENILSECEASIIFLSKDFLPSVLSMTSQIRIAVIFDFSAELGNSHEKSWRTQEIDDLAGKKGIRLIGFWEFLRSGQAGNQEENSIKDNNDRPAPDDLAMILYTSGTTGMPKGVKLEHGNILSTCSALQETFPPEEKDRYLSYLPLSHGMEHISFLLLFLGGGAIGFPSGNLKALGQDIQEFQPTIFSGVPRIFQRFYQEIFSKDDQLSIEYQRQLLNVQQGKTIDSNFLEQVVSPIKARLGFSSCRLATTGGAPMPGYLMDFIRVFVGGDVLQGFGLTETASGGTCTNRYDFASTSVGAPLAACHVKLVNIPEMNYFTHDKPHPRGEIWIKGSNCFQGYWKNEKAGEEMLRPSGWLATGDVGRWNPNGTLSIIDRRKNLFKLSQGEYLSPDFIESEYLKSSFVAQAFITGNSQENLPVGIFVPNLEKVWTLAKEKGWVNSSNFSIGNDSHRKELSDLISSSSNSEEIHRLFSEELRSHEDSLKGYEKIVEFYLEVQIDNFGLGFSLANGLLTNSLKLKRPALNEKYAAIVDKLYRTDNKRR